jgi:predicted TIM-barrel fold metal-dependent hydrolase
MDNTTIISADSHVVEPADLWEQRLDRKHRDSAPRVVQQDGKWLIVAPKDGVAFPVAGQFAAGMRGEELRAHLGKGYEAGRPSGWDPTFRAADQDADGVKAEVLYTSNGLALFSIQDAELQRACFRVYNDWLAEYCAVNPKRLIGIALISMLDIGEGVKELERCAKIGLRGAMISNGPNQPYHRSLYNPFWQAASELNMPLSLHIITTSKKQSVTDFAKGAGGNPFMILFDWVHETQGSLAALIMGGVLERFPKLKLVSTENDIGWLPHFLYRLDHNHDLGVQPNLTPLKPSEYARRQLWATFQDDPCGVALYKMFGEDNFMWASDFPHLDSTWPHSREVIKKTFGAIPPEVTRKIVCDNAARLYGLQLE